MPASRRLLLPAFATLAVLACAPSALAASGSIAGTLPGTMPAKQKGEANVRAISLADGRAVAAGTASRRGAFRLTVPAGAYAVLATVVTTRGKAAPASSVLAVSVRSGQRRAKLKLRPKRKARRSAARPHAAYVQENGRSTLGTAVAVEPFTGATGELAVLNRGLASMVETDLVNGVRRCRAAVIANSEDRKRVQGEIDLQKSPYFDPKTRVTRNFIAPDVVVRGTLANTAGGGVDVTLTLEDARSGATIGTLTASLGRDGIFSGAERLASDLTDRVCRQPEAYQLTLDVQAKGDFTPTHTAAGTVAGTIVARAQDGTAGTAPTRWTSEPSEIEWRDRSAAGLIGPCTFIPGSSEGRWGATVSAQGDGTIKVVIEGLQAVKAFSTAVCPSPAPPIPSYGGPALAGIGPETFTLPAGGGRVVLSGAFLQWSSAGSVTVRPSEPPR